MKRRKKRVGIYLAFILLAISVMGCAAEESREENTELSADNVIITETGETLIKQQPTAEPKTTDTPAVEEWGELPAPDVVPEVEIREPEQEQVITEADQISPSGSELQIVFLGDSIFDNNRDGSGIPYLTSVACNADCYNLAIGGTCAAIELTEQYENENWTSKSLVGMVKAIRGDIPTDVFEGTRAKEILDSGEVDFKNTDYFVIEYGMNDFFRATPLTSDFSDYDIRTYVGALRYAVSNLKDYANDATIILCGPNFAQFYAGDRFIGDGQSLNTGYGTLFNYAGKCQYVAREQQVHFFDAYLDLGIDAYNADEYLEDGVHLSEAGRHLYADALANKILEIEETKNN
ncbi:MAG: SGNH/GDSL hydrolase family protein [Lachnospiraceae bacterium]|nr:SGNH/GDSL hydrolase family protein [Lachnospiraceae bacterium]